MQFKELSFSCKNMDTSIYFSEGEINEILRTYLEDKAQFSQKILITDTLVEELYGIQIANEIGAEIVSVNVGEKSKSLNEVFYLIEKLFDLKIDKNGVIIALGGGVVCDIAAFLASIYMRGISLILIPTTLLAMVDASIGGKTGVDYKFAKNFIGSFYFPNAIFIDTKFLSTLPKKEYFCGLAEIIKLGIASSLELTQKTASLDDMLNLIRKAVTCKLEIVTLDPYDRGIRRLLNFGHTIGHGLEACSSYAITHGEAVAIGCVTEGYLSFLLGYLSKTDFDSIFSLFKDFDLRLPNSYSREKLEGFLKKDKKNENGQAHFVMIERIGKACSFNGKYVTTANSKAIKQALNFMEEVYV